MYYNYLEMTKEELTNLYKKNINSIKYYQDKIDRENKILIPALAILFFSILTFGGIGIYYCIGNEILGILIGTLFLFSTIALFGQFDYNSKDNLYIELLKEDNNFIYLVLLNKYNFDVIFEKQT